MYAFEGEVIKLTDKHFAKWKSLFEYCNLVEELEGLDMFWQNELTEGHSIKNWYYATYCKLRYRNDQLKAQGKPKGCFDRLTDKSWAEGMVDNVISIKKA